MSAELLGMGFKADVRPHAYKLVLLKLIDACRDDGTKIFPSVETIAKAAGVSTRHTQRVLHAFVDVQLLSVVRVGGKGRRDTTEYALDVEMLRRLGTTSRVTFENGRGTVVSKGDTASPKQERVTSEPLKDDSGVVQPLKEPLTSEREGARARGENSDALGRTMRNAATLDALIAAWKRGAIGGAGALGDLDKALMAIDALEPEEHDLATERAPRFLRAIKDAKRSFTMSIERYVHGRNFIHHPPPAKASPDDLAPVELRPFTAPLWLLMWKALNKARSSPENLQHRRRLLDTLDWIERGATMPAATVPPEAESSALVPIKTDSPEFVAWRDYAARVGLPKLPKPDHVPVIFVPAQLPPTLTGTYPLALPVRIEVVGQTWWWRYWQRIREGNPVVIEAGQHTIDALGRARRSFGAQEVTAGPLPLPADLAELVQIEPTTRPFEAWTDWLTARGTNSLWMWDRGPIWVPTEYPQAGFGTEAIETPDYDALEDISAQHNGEAA